jgi:TRAP-type C4-dicarboxylate transport system permease small subunit
VRSDFREFCNPLTPTLSPNGERERTELAATSGESVERWRKIPSLVCGVLAAACLAAMMLVTVVDVVLRATSNVPIRGVYELVELLLAYTFFIALPAVFLRDENIAVNVVDDLKPRWVPALKRIAAALAVVVLAVMAWQGALAARDTIAFNDVTADLSLPKSLHWIALLVGVIGAAVAALAMGLRGDARR